MGISDLGLWHSVRTIRSASIRFPDGMDGRRLLFFCGAVLRIKWYARLTREFFQSEESQGEQAIGR